jgi:hypothetical protein
MLSFPIPNLKTIFMKSSTQTIRGFTNIITGLLCAALVGCAAPGLDRTAKTLDLSTESVAIISVNMTNEIKPSFRVSSMMPRFSQVGASGRAVTGQGLLEDKAEDILVSVKLAPGKYDLSRLTGIARGFLINAALDFAVHADIEIAPNSVIYLGHIKLVNKEKANKDDQSSGAVIPLIDQAVAGFANGTLSVSLSDRYERDIDLFKSNFPALQGVTIVRAPIKLMSLERATASSAAPIAVTLDFDKK